jgi:hypothetical protein
MTLFLNIVSAGSWSCGTTWGGLEYASQLGHVQVDFLHAKMINAKLINLHIIKQFACAMIDWEEK